MYDELRIKYRFLRRILDSRLGDEKGKFKAVLIDEIVRVHVGNSRVCAKVMESETHVVSLRSGLYTYYGEGHA